MGIDETPNDNERRRIEVEMFIRVHSMTQKLFRNEFFLNIYTFFNNLLVQQKQIDERISALEVLAVNNSLEGVCKLRISERIAGVEQFLWNHTLTIEKH